MPWRIAAAAIVGYGVTAGTLVGAQRSLMYQNGREAPDLARSSIDAMNEVILETEDGLFLVAWYREAATGMPVITVFHGNAGHIGHRTAKLAPLADAGFGLLLVEYRGYGGNPGKPDEDGLYTDGRAALDWLAVQGIAGDNLVIYGESLGTGVAVTMASERDVGAVVLEASYNSLAEVAGGLYWFVPFASHAVMDRFDSGERIATIGAPVLMMHGAADNIIPLRQAQTLHSAAAEPKEFWLADQAGHNDLYDHGAAEVVLGFLDTHLNETP
ncbi:MAG: alpha/beta hydrolase [Alphaproteobacteria bacterium]|nr:alpha/beta hydrolase [Rhodospirillaceae bacterium]MDG2482855.1 alpha/beta hydrolase [Alphaproteobacteria bacterium]MBT6205292.1 alpha/beta hydrolase [Rhodospirillaceae bacterium]MBT6510559.1 alpha/beta hydrolase [Rhodospirillaceae bacterium]MBT7613193.1 alpha/beta hydrolase [Rhodospirillaceae bacterium]